jgi:hypothetical protein
MKIKQSILLMGLFLTAISFMSSTCNTEDDNPPDPGCSGYAQMTVTGYINNTFCFDDNLQFSYEAENQLVVFSAIVTIDDAIYSCGITINDFTGEKSYACGLDKPGYIELVKHGNDNEYYKSQSGTVNVTKIDDTHFEATFNVEAKGYYNNKSVTLQGWAKK